MTDSQCVAGKQHGAVSSACTAVTTAAVDTWFRHDDDHDNVDHVKRQNEISEM